MKFENGKVCFESQEEAESLGVDVSWHTTYYTHGITQQLEGVRVGFHNWLDATDCYIGYEEVRIENQQQFDKVLRLMHAMREVKEEFGIKDVDERDGY